MVWNMLKVGANMVKRILFLIYNRGTKALFWSGS